MRSRSGGVSLDDVHRELESTGISCTREVLRSAVQTLADDGVVYMDESDIIQATEMGP